MRQLLQQKPQAVDMDLPLAYTTEKKRVDYRAWRLVRLLKLCKDMVLILSLTFLRSL